MLGMKDGCCVYVKLFLFWKNQCVMYEGLNRRTVLFMNENWVITVIWKLMYFISDLLLNFK